MSGPKRILLITRRFWPMVGSTPTLIGQVASGLVARGFRVTVLTVSWSSVWPTPVHWREFPVIRLLPPPNSGWNMFRYLRRLAGWLSHNKGDFDLVYVCGMKHEAHAAMKYVARGVPVVLRAESAGRHGDCVWQVESRAGRKIKPACLKAAALVAGEQIVAEELRAAGYPRSRVYYLPNGVAIAQPRTAETKITSRTALATAHMTLDMPSWAPLAVCTGLHFSERTLSDLILAWQSVAARWPNARLWLTDGSRVADALQRRIVGLDLAGRVVPIGRFDDLGELLRAADLFVQPTRTAGTSLPLLEAMGAGLPVIAADDQANRQWIVDQQQGLLVPPNDPNTLAQAMVRLFDEREMALQLGKAARRRASQEFPLAKMVDAHVTLLEHLLNEQSSRRLS